MGKKRSLHSATIKALNASGFLVEEVERAIPGTNMRRDLFGIIDLLALHPQQQMIVGVQVTSTANRSSRLRKIQASGKAVAILQSGMQIWLALWCPLNTLSIERLELVDGVSIQPTKTL